MAYYHHFALEGPEDSIADQRNQIHTWVEKNGVEIFQGFADYGELGVDPENRPAFRDLILCVAKCTAFLYLLAGADSVFGCGQVRPNDTHAVANDWAILRELAGI